MLLKKFMGLDRIIRIIVLVIPFVNWICELALRWSIFLEKKDVVSLVIAIVTTFGGGFIIGWLDFIWMIVYDKLALLDVKVNN